MSEEDHVFDALVIGAGQAGLAAGYHLTGRKLRFAILESAGRVGDQWRSRWDSLRFSRQHSMTVCQGFLPRRQEHLPGQRGSRRLSRRLRRTLQPARADRHSRHHCPSDGRRVRLATTRAHCGHVTLLSLPARTPSPGSLLRLKTSTPASASCTVRSTAAQPICPKATSWSWVPELRELKLPGVGSHPPDFHRRPAHPAYS